MAIEHTIAGVAPDGIVGIGTMVRAVLVQFADIQYTFS